MSELTCFVVDVASLKGDQWLKPFTYVEYVLLNKVQTQRKTDYVQLNLVNVPAEGSDTSLPVDNMAMLPVLPRAPVSVDDARDWLAQWYDARDQAAGDDMLFNGLLISVLKLKEFVGKRKMKVKLVVFTTQSLDDVTEEESATFADQCPFDLVVVNCSTPAGNDDQRFGAKWLQLGAPVVYRIDEMVQSVADPRLKLTRPIRTFQGQLRLGDVNAADAGLPSMCINVEGVPGTKSVTSVSRKVMRKQPGAEGGTFSYHAVKSVIEYQIEDEAEGGSVSEAHGTAVNADAEGRSAAAQAPRMINVSKDYVRKAYRYGADYVDLPAALDQERKLSEQPGLDIRGFMDIDELPRHYLCSESLYVVPDSKNGSRGDYLGFVTLVDSLISMKRVIIARFVPKSGNEVQMCCLSPIRVASKSTNQDRDEVRVLVLTRLPMSEDERTSTFPKMCESTEWVAEMDDTMAQFVDSMDLDAEARDLPWYESDQVQKFSDVAVEQSTLPLPQSELFRATARNPLAVPAISLHRQQQVILECVHQKCIVADSQQQSRDLDIPPMSQTILDKITPQHGAPVSLSNKIKEQFGVIKRDASAAASASAALEGEQVFEEEDPELFDLDLLLARGAR
ncbi:unnamed protein product [Kluyveromyces dobzhanskii CBS 2104]|uniref:ATP-dependent DNA helicase II subunit 2 n=1 Tax=Kluyveromyces dobzhanskii CBS 2104 TaxID=1427455 RepID=A0A0A8LAI6_9SACH|nr:unnamed protein product [Kluyveromyces dobzhanskii CBS 2104]